MNMESQAQSDSLEFRTKLWRRSDEFCLAALFLGVELFGFYGCFREGFKPVAITSLALFGLMLGGALWFILVPAYLIRIQPESVIFRSPLKTTVILDSNVETFSAGRSGSSSILTVKLLTGKQLYTRVGVYEARARIVMLLTERYKKAEGHAIHEALANGHKFETRLGALLIQIFGGTGLFIGSVLLSAPNRSLIAALTALTIGVILIVLPMILPKSYLQIGDEGIKKCSMFGTSEILWSQVTALRLVNIQSRNGPSELISIESSGTVIRASDASVSDFAFLRDIAISAVPKEKVKDERPT
jgi:hypothetical protein